MFTDSTSAELITLAPLPKSAAVLPARELSIGTPSMMYSGELLFSEEMPRTSTFCDTPAVPPLEMFTPATLPVSPAITEPLCAASSFSDFTVLEA